MGLFGKRKSKSTAAHSGGTAGVPGYLAPYQQAVDAEGATFEALLWRNKDFQTIRFHTLTELACVRGRVTADMGSGRADLLALWREQGLDDAGYVGVEAVAELAGFCRERIKNEGLEHAAIEEGDFAADRRLFDRLIREHRVDVLLFSGSLNTFEPHAAEAVLERAWEALCRHAASADARPKTLAFNFLSSLAAKEGEDLGPARRFDTHAMIAWALARTPRVRFRHDYLNGRDATIAMDTPGDD
ncbi:MAG: hypothetical protein AAGK04_03065 [Planctomycetota bacterium]